MHNHPDLSSPEKPGLFYGYVVVATSFFVLVILLVSIFSFGVFLKPIAADFGWTRAAISGALSVNVVVFGLLFLVTGRLTDRFGPRVITTICGLFLGLGLLLMSQISALWHLYLFYGIIVAIGLSGGYVPLVSTVAKWFVEERGLMISITSAGVGVGAIIGPPLAGWLITSHGWRTSYLAIGITAMLLIALIAQFLRRAPGYEGQLPQDSKQPRNKGLVLGEAGLSFQEAIRTRQLWILCIIFVLYGFSNMAVIIHIVPYATDLGISTITAANILTAIGTINLIGRIIMGSTSDRVGNRASLIIGFTIQLIALLLLQFTREPWMFYMFAVIFGFSSGGVIVLVASAVAEFFGLKAHGVIMGMITLGANLGGATGPVLAGHMFDTTNSYQSAFLSFAIASVIALLLSFLLRHTQKQSLM
ncbi:MFS transporter [Chloroflexota bacterium]